MTRRALALLAAAVAPACAADLDGGPAAAGVDAGLADDTGEDIGTIDQATTVVANDTFESRPLGPLGSPWTLTPAGSATTATVVSTADHGHALLIDGSTRQGDYLIAALPLSSSATTIRARVDVEPAPGSAFLWSLNGAGTSIGRRRIRLQVDPGSALLSAQTAPSGTTACATLRTGVWSRVTLVVHAAVYPHTFDVLIDGVATACKGITAGISPPFNGVQLWDPSSEGYGGDVLWDNVAVTTP